MLVTHLRHGVLSLHDATRLQAAAESLMEGKEQETASGEILALAASSGCTACDCEYVSLAIALGVPLDTHDRKIRRAFPEVAISPEGFLRG